MSAAQTRMAAAARLDAARNSEAIGAARERCIADAAARITYVLIGDFEFSVPLPGGRPFATANGAGVAAESPFHAAPSPTT